MNAAKAYAYSVGARSAFDVFGTATSSNSLFPAPRWWYLDAESAVGYDLARVMARFGVSVQCGRDALAAGEDIDQLPDGCTDGALPRRLPLRHVTATHAAARR